MSVKIARTMGTRQLDIEDALCPFRTDADGNMAKCDIHCAAFDMVPSKHSLFQGLDGEKKAMWICQRLGDDANSCGVFYECGEEADSDA